MKAPKNTKSMPLSKLAGKKGSGKTKRITIEKAANGGYIVNHDNSAGSMEYQPPVPHTFDDHADMIDHVNSVFGGKSSSKDAC